MKTKRTNTLAKLTGLTMVLGLTAAFVGSATAQDLTTTKGAGARLLLDLNNKFSKPAPAESDYTPMTCAKCTDKVIERVDTTARGANKPVVLATKHLCGGCGTDWAVTGHGKEKQSVAIHKCTACGGADAACCSTGKGAGPTKGMEKS